jgi:cation diffusion facilitator family transporter
MQTGQKVAAAGIAVSVVLAVVKIAAGWIGRSSAVLADGFESVGDVFASSLVMLGLTLAAKPADQNHPYGHGRIETLTGLLIGLALTAGGAVIGYASLNQVGERQAPPATFVIWPLAGSALVKTALSGVKFHYGRKLKSSALLADAWNDTVDILSAATALAAVGLAISNPDRFLDADHWGGFAVGLIVIFTGLRVAYETSSHLVDTMPGEQLMTQIRGVALRVPGVRGVEKCYARKTGLRYHVDLHLEVDPEITVRESHYIGHQVQEEIRRSLEWVADVLIHVEPAPPAPVSARRELW